MRFNEINDPVRVRGLELVTELCEMYPTRMRQSYDTSAFYLEVYGSPTIESLSHFTAKHNLKVVRNATEYGVIILSSEL